VGRFWLGVLLFVPWLWDDTRAPVISVAILLCLLIWPNARPAADDDNDDNDDDNDDNDDSTQIELELEG